MSSMAVGNSSNVNTSPASSSNASSGSFSSVSSAKTLTLEEIEKQIAVTEKRIKELSESRERANQEYQKKLGILKECVRNERCVSCEEKFSDAQTESEPVKCSGVLFGAHLNCQKGAVEKLKSLPREITGQLMEYSNGRLRRARV